MKPQHDRASTEPDPIRSFGVRLEQARRFRGLTRRELARLVGCDPKAIERYERGSMAPRFPTLLRLRAALNTSLEFLAAGERSIKDLDLLKLLREVEALPEPSRGRLIDLIKAELLVRRTEGAAGRTTRKESA